jgi:HAE1 family hydrophobic/amphiphilic exporter-1
MISLILIIVGVVSSSSLKRELFPDISFPIVSITTIYPGASSDVMDQDVSAVIEKSMNSLPGVQSVRSTSSEGFAFTVLQFDVDADPKESKSDVQDKLSTLRLPASAQKPTVGTFDFNSLPLVVASIGGDNLSDVQSRVESDLIPAIAAIPGVNNVAITGGQQEKVIVNLDPVKMAANNLTQAQVIQFLQANNIAFPVGSVTDAGRSLPLRITHKYSSTAEIANVVVGIKGVNLAGGGAGGFGGAGGAAAPAPAAVATVVPTAPVTSTAPITASLVPAELAAFGITTPEQITPLVIGQVPEANLSQIPLALALAISPESQAALAKRLPAPEVPAQLKANGITKPEQITPQVLALFPAPALAQLPVNLALALPAETRTALATALAATPATPATTPAPSAGQLPAEFAAFGITSPDQITPELIGQIPANLLSVFTPEIIATLPAASQEALAQRLNNPDGASANAGVPEALLIRLSDVGTVEVGAIGGNTVTRTNGRASIGLEISKDTLGNTVDIVDAVKKEFDRVNATPGASPLTIQIVSEQGTAITKSVNAVLSEGAIGAVVAVIIIFLFLRSIRSTLVTAVSIPLSVVVALVLMRVQGFSLNVMTLGGLTVAVGRVVDDAIVVLENIYRHINRGENVNKAVLDGTREVAGAITASTLTTVCVFLPLGFVGGIVSKFFLPFALTVTYALLASLVVALTVVPLLARLFIKPNTKPEPESTLLQRLYTPVLSWSLRSTGTKFGTLAIALLLLAGSLALAPLLKVTFLPNNAEKNISISITTPAGTNLETTGQRVDEVEAIVSKLRADGKVRDIQTIIGRAGDADRSRDQSGGAGAANRAQIRLTLNADNIANPEALAKDLETQIKTIDGIETAQAEVVAAGGGGPSNAGLDITLVSADINKLREANDKVMAKIGGNNASDRFPIANIKSSLAEVKPELEIAVDPQKAIASGTSTAQIGLQLRALFNGENAGSVTLADNAKKYDIFVQVDPAFISIDKLRKLPVGTVNPVPLEQVATIEEAPGASSITRINGDRAASISGQFTSDDTFSTQTALEQEIVAIGLPEGVRLQTGQQAQSQSDTFRDMGLALLVAIVLVYIVMVLSFGSLLNPFIILFSLPLAIIGVMLALFITGKPLGITTLIGVLMLIGIVVTNAIVLIELVEQYRERGMSTYDALVRAGRVRLRPILMTAIATMVALLPLALGLEEGGFIGADLGVVVIGGLFTSTFLTLLVVPVVYSLMDSLKTRFGFGHPVAVETEAATVEAGHVPALGTETNA